jgi:hypothetical protein
LDKVLIVFFAVVDTIFQTFVMPKHKSIAIPFLHCVNDIAAYTVHFGFNAIVSLVKQYILTF